MNALKTATLLTTFFVSTILTGQALAEGEVNVYSSRHYDTDARLFSDFTEETGIKINLIEGKISALMERLRAEGKNSPADIIVTTDAGRLFHLEEMDLVQGVQSAELETNIPENLRHPDGKWFGVTQRARVIYYDKNSVTNPPQTYADLADPKYKGMICARSSSNIYMISLLASQISHIGIEAAKAWATGLYNNFAREPQGGDTDQLRAIASGECQIVIANTYYFARALRTEVRGLSDATDRIGIVFPDQDGNGTHVNISGAGVAKYAPNKDNAIKLLEYFTSYDAQNYFASGNDEYPVVKGVALSSSVQQLGTFKADDLALEELGKNQALAQTIYNEIGYK